MRSARCIGAACAVLVLISLLFTPAAAVAATPADAALEAGVQKVIAEQTAAWNRKDLEGYMAGYWKSPELTFFGGDTVTKGWQATLERYKARYKTGGFEMGTLSFSDMSILPLGPDAALARGLWRLALSGGKERHGLFTVIFRRFPEGWRIVHDHSC